MGHLGGGAIGQQRTFAMDGAWDRQRTLSANRKGGIPVGSFHEAGISLIPKASEGNPRVENYRSCYSLVAKAKTLDKILAIRMQQHREKIVFHDQVGLFPRLQGGVNIPQSTERLGVTLICVLRAPRLWASLLDARLQSRWKTRFVE